MELDDYKAQKMINQEMLQEVWKKFGIQALRLGKGNHVKRTVVFYKLLIHKTCFN